MTAGIRKARLASLIGGKVVYCVVSGKDKYKRLLVTCDVDGQEIEAGWLDIGAAGHRGWRG